MINMHAALNKNKTPHSPEEQSGQLVKRPAKAMAFGTFDRLHKGHGYFLREAKKRGDFLVVVVARDRTVGDVKGRMPDESEGERKKNVEKTGIPDKVVLGSLGDKYDAVREEKPDVICLGYDQQPFVDGLESALKSMGMKAGIVRIGAYMPEKYKTSLMKKEK